VLTEPTEDWLRAKEVEFVRVGLPHTDRPWRAWQAYGERVGIALPATDPRVRRIFAWFEGREGRAGLSYSSRVLFAALVGLLWGLFLALLSIIGGIARSEAGLATVVNSLLTYGTGGLVSGTVVGVCHRLVRNRAWAAVIGVLGLLPTVVLVNRRMAGPMEGWPITSYGVVLVVTIVLGAPLGWLLYPVVRRELSSLAEL
jgi:hypothetical protein